MRLPRLRLTIGAALLGVTGIAIVLGWVASRRDRPRWEASAWIEVRRGDPEVCARDVLSAAVLDEALDRLSRPVLGGHPPGWLTSEAEPREALRRRLTVETSILGRHLRVSVTSDSEADACRIVIDVADACSVILGPERVEWPGRVESIRDSEKFRQSVVLAIVTILWVLLVLIHGLEAYLHRDHPRIRFGMETQADLTRPGP